MLQTLRIEHFYLIEQAELIFKPGLTVITGETGAGKSLILRALNLLLGKASSSGCIPPDQPHSIIEGVFTFKGCPTPLKPYLDDHNQLRIFRRLSKTSSSTIRLNSETIPLKKLRSLAPYLAQSIGQHEHLHLFSPDTQLSLIDHFDTTTLTPLITAYKDTYKKLKAIEKQRQETSEYDTNHIDFLTFQATDISDQQFAQDEETHLKETSRQLQQIEHIRKEVSLLKETLYRVEGSLATCQQTASKLSDTSESFSIIHDRITSLALETTDIYQTVQDKQQEISHLETHNQASIEQRLDTIYTYKTKYKVRTLEELIEKHIHIKETLDNINNQRQQIIDLTNTYNTYLKDCQTAALTLHKARKKVASELETHLQIELESLNLTNCSLAINLIFDPNTCSPSGGDLVDFRISTNPGSPLAPLRKVASGGELSRILLAIQSLFSEQLKDSCLVFDEIDTGVGGLTASKIGDKLKSISVHNQVITITHLAQIASLAHHHICVEKFQNNSHTSLTIQSLDESVKQHELKRMMGGQQLLSLVKSNNTLTKGG